MRATASVRTMATLALVAPALAVLGCGERPSISESRASELLSTLRARPGSPVGFGAAEKLVLDHGRLHPGFPALSPKPSAHVTLPAHSTGAVHVEDAVTGAGIDVTLVEARDSVGRTVEGTVVYAAGHASGATLIHRPVPEGNEDYLTFDSKPASSSVAYDVKLGLGVAALRLVENQLEMLDAQGTPRLRVAPPYLVGAAGEEVPAALAVEGCAVDTNPAAPWGRAVTPPGAATCRVRVSWEEKGLSYPAVLDPRWVSTQNMTSVRQDFTATLMSTGKVLAVGGRTSGTSTTGLATAELFDPTTNTWSTTTGISGGRYMHTAVQLGPTSSSTTTGKVFVAGGTNAGASLNTAQLYSPSGGTWVAATALNAARQGHTATLLGNGNVLLAAGLSGTTVLNTAAVYNPSSGGGTFTATGTMPQAVKFQSATLLAVPGNGTLNNKVLVVGGNSGSTSVTNVQLFDGTSTWSSLSALSSSREGHTATALSGGNVLITGGRSGSTTLNTTLIFNAASGSGSWSSAGTLTAARQLHTATLLSPGIVKNGSVLVAGGSSGAATLTSAELWNGTSTWTATTSLPSALQGQVAVPLNNNLVLLAGGANGSTTVATSTVYDGSWALACTSNSQCVTGFCVSGVCCDTACNGGCGVCNLTGKVGTCSPAATGTVCRAQNGVCDVSETCNGTSLSCPADGFAPSTTVCRPTAGACDIAEKCTGASPTCPADAFASSATVCRQVAGACDVAEQCTGTSAACPTDGFLAAGTTCRPIGGACDIAEACSGTSATCPPDAFLSSSTVCRPTAGPCDAPENCSGNSAACPPDAFLSSSTVCRPAAQQCDAAETCTGAGATCPADLSMPNGSPCNDGNACTQTDTCQTGMCAGTNSIVCVAQDQCHAAGICDPGSGTCSNPIAHNISCPTSNADILGFEDPGRWAVSSGAVSATQQDTQGNAALSIASPINYTTIVSDVLTSTGPELSGITDGASFLVDLLLPTQQPNPNWFGSLQMFVSSPSRGVYNQYLGDDELTGAALGVFSTWEFTFPSFVIQQLSSGPFNDLTVTIALNVPYQGTGTYILDNLRLKGPVKPVLECVSTLGAGSYRALFGYTNSSSNDYALPVGNGNSVTPAPADRGQPTVFNPGSHSHILTADFTGPSLSWEVRGQVATATPSSPPCVEAPTVAPILECVLPLGGGQYRAIFGYDNGSGAETTVPPSDQNKVDPSSNNDRGQLTDFQLGRHDDAFSIDFDGSPLTWSLLGASVTASSSSAPCPPQPAVTPILEGIQILGPNSFKAFFGYQNDTGGRITIPPGPFNMVTPSTPGELFSRGQPTTFDPGRQKMVFAVESDDGSPVVWAMAGSSQAATMQSSSLSSDLEPVALAIPTQINVCEDILNLIFRPASFDNVPDCRSTSWEICLADPICCAPKPICLSDGACVALRLVETIAAYWSQDVDLTCHLRSLKEVLAQIFVVDALHPIVSAALLHPAQDQVELAKTFADPLPDPVRAILEDLIAPDVQTDSASFLNLDVESAVTIGKSGARSYTVAPFLEFAEPTTNGMTLETLIIMTDDDELAALSSGDYPTPQGFRDELPGGPSFGQHAKLHSAIATLVHELTHVRQYRDMGWDGFVEEYYLEIALDGYQGSPLEQEARNYKEALIQRLGGI